MDSSFKTFKFETNGFKRKFSTNAFDEGLDKSLVNPSKKFSFGSASSFNDVNRSHQDSFEQKEYKLDESILNNHWLFADESPKRGGFTAPYVTHPNQNSIATTRVPSIDVIKGFKLASGKQFEGLTASKKSEFRRFLGLDDDDFSLSDKSYKLPTSRYDNFQPPKSFRSAQANSAYEEDYLPTQCTSQATTEAATPRNLSFVEAWNGVCTFTKYYTSNMSLRVLLRLWHQYGNPFKVTGANVKYYKYLLYTHENDFVSFGGAREISACFKRMIAGLDVKRELFDDAWLRDRFNVLTLSSCRRYRKKVLKLYKKNNLEDSIASVPLPNPINLLKMLLRCVRNEGAGPSSVVNKIFQGETSPDVPVVLRVQEFDGTCAFLTNGVELYKCVFADSLIKGLFESNRIKEGFKILIQGIVHSEIKGEFVIVLSFNAVSSAARRNLGLQPKHTNVNIKDLCVSGGRVSRVEIVVLRNLPIAYRVCYRCPETSERRFLVLSEREYLAMSESVDSEFLGLIERVSTQFTMFAIDAAVLHKHVSEGQLERLLRRSCAHVNFINVDDTVSYFLKPFTRFVLTNTAITNLGNDFIYPDHSEVKPVKLSCTEYTKLDVLENNVKVQESIANQSELARILFNRQPALSLAEDADDLDEFNRLLHEKRCTRPFLGQVCDLNGVILHVGELESAQKYCFLMFFMLTTKLQLVCVKLNYKNQIAQNDKLSITSEIKAYERRLRSLAVRFESEGKAPNDEKTKIFYGIQNAQYIGFDPQNGIYNFQISCEHMSLKESNTLRQLQNCFNEKNLVFKSSSICLSTSSYEQLGSTHLENICKILFIDCYIKFWESNTNKAAREHRLLIF